MFRRPDLALRPAAGVGEGVVVVVIADMMRGWWRWRRRRRRDGWGDDEIFYGKYRISYVDEWAARAAWSGCLVAWLPVWNNNTLLYGIPSTGTPTCSLTRITAIGYSRRELKALLLLLLSLSFLLHPNP